MSSLPNKISKPNFLLIAGDGRNVGKTYLACKIISHLSKKLDVIGIKITPHFHKSEVKNILQQTKEFVIAEENEITEKDSSLLLQAGAKKVYFIMVKPDKIKEAFFELEKLLPVSPVVCESGGLNEVIQPGLFLFVKKKGVDIQKSNYLKYSPLLVENDGKDFTFHPESIQFINNRFSIE